MDNVLSVEVNQTLTSHIYTVLAELFRVLALELLEHGSESATIHQFHEDPESVLEVKRLITLDNGLTVAHLHNTDFIFNCSAFFSSLWFRKLEGKELAISDSHAAEYSCETAGTFLAHDLVELRGVLLLNIGSVTDLFANFSTVLECLFRRVQLAEDYFEQRGWILSYLFRTENAQLLSKRGW